MGTVLLAPAAQAFDAVAAEFDARFGAWASVTAQRQAVRTELAGIFPPGARLVEIGGGTGEDALWLAQRGRAVLSTDPSPAMVRIASQKLAGQTGSEARVLAAEALLSLGADGEDIFDGAYSNFAALNCVGDLHPVALGLARLLRPGAHAALVLFGVCCPGEWLVEAVRGRWRAMFRRVRRGAVAARLGGQAFPIHYHRCRSIEAAFTPWFRLRQRRAIGLFVPPSAAEPWISRHPALLNGLERLDRELSQPLAMFGDHILYDFVRTDAA